MKREVADLQQDKKKNLTHREGDSSCVPRSRCCIGLSVPRQGQGETRRSGSRDGISCPLWILVEIEMRFSPFRKDSIL